MHLKASTTSVNAIFLYILNISFMLTGIFLNSLVITSLWRSSQLRMKLCYFMILVLSCFDMAVVSIIHPLLIWSTISWYMGAYHEDIEATRINTSILLQGFSMFALLTLNIERFLALTCPFFHQRAVTKVKLIIFLALQMIILVALSPLLFFYAKTIGNMLITALLSFALFVFIFLNYKVLDIAKSKRENGRVAPTDIATVSYEERKKEKRKYRSISTCSLAVCCFFICFSPEIINSAWRFTLKDERNNKQFMLFNIWSNTFSAIGSTLNCLIFFWRNSILHREGMRIAKCLRTLGS